MTSKVDKEIQSHLDTFIKRSIEGKGKVVVLVQDAPGCEFQLEKVEPTGGMGLRLVYREEGEEGTFAAEISGDPNAEGTVMKTPTGIRGRDRDGERVEVRFFETKTRS